MRQNKQHARMCHHSATPHCCIKQLNRCKPPGSQRKHIVRIHLAKLRSTTVSACINNRCHVSYLSTVTKARCLHKATDEEESAASEQYVDLNSQQPCTHKQWGLVCSSSSQPPACHPSADAAWKCRRRGEVGWKEERKRRRRRKRKGEITLPRLLGKNICAAPQMLSVNLQ